jgi:hypothetical protein
MKQRMMNAVVIVGVALSLVACSGGGGDGGGGTPAAAPTLTGTFVDAPVAGLPYATSSGLSGVTNLQGQFSYRSGDTVQFSYGQTVLGSIPAVPQVTPWTVFGLNSPDTADPRWINLARLLQTFNNVLPPVTPAIQAFPAVNFNLATADFGADPAVVQMLTAAPLPLVSAAEATLTLGQQFVILGSWQRQSQVDAAFTVFTAMADGTYVVSEDGASDLTGKDGMERGTYTYDPVTGAFTRTILVDTNGTIGISSAGPPMALFVNADVLTFADSGSSEVFTRVIATVAPANSFVGAWRFDNTDGVAGSLVVLTLFENGIFVLAGDEALPSSDGIEKGIYSVGMNDIVTFTRIIDTNTTAGIFGPTDVGPVVVSVVVNGDTMTFNDGNETYTGTRIRPPQ